MRAVKPGGSQCCFEQIPSPMLCRLIIADHDQTLIDDQTLVTDVVSPDHFWSLESLLDLQWSFLIKDWLTLVPRSPWVYCLSGQMLFCVEHTDHIWPTAKHFICHIWSRWGGWPRKSWNSVIGAATGLKILCLGHLRTPGLCEKPQETQWLLSYFIGTPTVRNNYDYEM